MAVHQLNISIELSAEEETVLCELFGCQIAQLGATLAPYGAAALREYADLFTGQAMMSVTDLRERRLLAILLALPPNQFPTEDKIARMFNLATAGARGLLRSTLSRHRNRLRSVLETAAKQFIAACHQPQGQQDWEGRYPSAVVVQMLNDRLAASAQPRRPITRVMGTFDTYSVSNGSMIELQQLYP